MRWPFMGNPNNEVELPELWTLENLLKMAEEYPVGFQRWTKSRRVRRFFRVLKENDMTIAVMTDLAWFPRSRTRRTSVFIAIQHGRRMSYAKNKSQQLTQQTPPIKLAPALIQSLEMEILGEQKLRVEDFITTTLSAIS